MRIPSFKLSIALVVAVAGVGAAVAVASPTRTAGPNPNAQAIQQAFQKTAKLPGFHFAFTVRLGGGGGSGYAVTGTGGVDTKAQASSFTVNLGALASLLGGASGGATIPSKLDGVASNGVLYFHAPSVATQVQPGAEWLSFDAKAIPSSLTTKLDPGSLSQQQVVAAVTASASVHKVGSATVRGTKTTHYRVTASAAKFTAALPASKRAGEVQALKALNLKSATFDVYVDGAGYVRRVAASVKGVKVQQGSAAASITAQVDLFDLGAQVKVSVPPASKTVSGDRLVQSLLGGIGG